MPPKRRKFESTFPAARIKKIMQLDDEVGRVASSVPAVISRAVEIFLNALLTRADGYAASRNARTLSVGHLKHCIEQEKQWDFLKELTAKIPDVAAEVENPEEAPPTSKRGRKRQASPGSKGRAPAGKRKRKAKVAHVEQEKREEEEEEEGEESASEESGTPEPSSARLLPASSSSRGSKASNLVSTAAKSTAAKSTTAKSPQGQPGVEVPEGGMLGQHQKQLSGGGGSLSISDLVAAGTALSNTRQESNSDDDYD